MIPRAPGPSTVNLPHSCARGVSAGFERMRRLRRRADPLTPRPRATSHGPRALAARPAHREPAAAGTGRRRPPAGRRVGAAQDRPRRARAAAGACNGERRGAGGASGPLRLGRRTEAPRRLWETCNALQDAMLALQDARLTITAGCRGTKMPRGGGRAGSPRRAFVPRTIRFRGWPAARAGDSNLAQWGSFARSPRLALLALLAAPCGRRRRRCRPPPRRRRTRAWAGCRPGSRAARTGFRLQDHRSSFRSFKSLHGRISAGAGSHGVLRRGLAQHIMSQTCSGFSMVKSMPLRPETIGLAHSAMGAGEGARKKLACAWRE